MNSYFAKRLIVFIVGLIIYPNNNLYAQDTLHDSPEAKASLKLGRECVSYGDANCVKRCREAAINPLNDAVQNCKNAYDKVKKAAEENAKRVLSNPKTKSRR